MTNIYTTILNKIPIDPVKMYLSIRKFRYTIIGKCFPFSVHRFLETENEILQDLFLLRKRTKGGEGKRADNARDSLSRETGKCLEAFYISTYLHPSSFAQRILGFINRYSGSSTLSQYLESLPQIWLEWTAATRWQQTAAAARVSSWNKNCPGIRSSCAHPCLDGVFDFTVIRHLLLVEN